MKYINFTKLSIKNFLSVGNDPVCIDFSPGIHIITGVNKDKQDRRNGVGKSTIADAIHFVIFGDTLRDLKKENIVNNINSKNCHVELDFNITQNDIATTYKIIRTLEPSRCRLYINGEDKTRDSINNTTEHICKLLSTSQEVFQNCVIMTVNNTVPFMGKKKIEKRKFIEGIFNLEAFSRMLHLVRSQYNDIKRDYDIETTRFEEVEKNIESLKDQKNKLIKRSRDRRKTLNGRQQDNIKELKRLEQKVFESNKTEIDEIQRTIDTIHKNINVCDDKVTNINRDISTYEANVKFNNDNLSKIGTDESVCPVCLRPVTDHDRNNIQQEKKKINDTIRDLKVNIRTCTTTLNTIVALKERLNQAETNQSKFLKDYEINIKECENTKQRMSQLDKWNSQIDEELQQLDKDAAQFDNSIKKCKGRISTLTNTIDNFKSKINILDAVKFIVSEEGVKSYIVRKILQVFNHKLSYYLNKMDANCLCIFNEYFEEEIVDEKGKTCSYFNFSGAERKNIDLACLFAFMDIRRLQGSVAYNFSVYDELLDSSLDERGVDIVLNLLRERVEKYNECIMIISHRKESINIGTHYKNQGGVIYLEKENGITKRVEFSETSV